MSEPVHHNKSLKISLAAEQELDLIGKMEGVVEQAAEATVEASSPESGDTEPGDQGVLHTFDGKNENATVDDGGSVVAPNLDVSHQTANENVTTEDTRAADQNESASKSEEHEETRIRTERGLIDEAEEALTAEDYLRIYLELVKLYDKKTAISSRPTRVKLAARLCALGVPLPSVDALVVTWNVGNARPAKEELEALIPCRTRLYDLVVVGLQECDYELDSEMHTQATEHMQERHAQRHRNSVIYARRDRWHSHAQPASSDMSLRTRLLLGHDDERDEVDWKFSSSPPQAQKQKFSPGRFFRQQADSAEKRAKRAVTSKAGAHFASMIQMHLGEDDYFMVRECELMQMRLFVFARKEHMPRLSHVEYASQATGIAGVVGNKGGVAVSMRFQDMRLCFVSCHLAAHRKYLSERNKDCEEILRMVQRKLATRSASYLSDWDYVFFFGDLNYRLGKSLISAASSDIDDEAVDDSALEFSESRSQTESGPLLARKATLPQTESLSRVHKADHTPEERFEVISHIESEAWQDIIAKDQLRKEQNEGRALMGFREADIYPFPPTFKVERKAELEYDAKRLPAYCDRILWHSTQSLQSNDSRLSLVELFSPHIVSTSDHKPVCARFKIGLSEPKKSMRVAARNFMMGLYLTRLTDKNPRRGMQICISKLQARNLLPMDFGGAADPYIVAYSTEIFGPSDKASKPSQGACRTKVCFGSLNCGWKDPLVVRCPPNLARPDDLFGKHLTLALWDFDTLSMDDYLGEVVISLDDAVLAFNQQCALISETFESSAKSATSESEETSEPTLEHPELFDNQLLNGEKSMNGARQFAFIFPVVRNGKKAGTLSGMMTLYRPEERLRVPTLRKIGWTWKCTAYVEQNTVAAKLMTSAAKRPTSPESVKLTHQ